MTSQPQLPGPEDPITPESFAELALHATPKTDAAALVLTTLNEYRISTGDLMVVENLPYPPAERARILTETTLFLYGASAPGWRYLAYAITEPNGEGHVAFVAITPPAEQQH